MILVPVDGLTYLSTDDLKKDGSGYYKATTEKEDGSYTIVAEIDDNASGYINQKVFIGVDSDQAMLFSGSDEAKANVILSSVLKNVGDSLVRMAEMEEEGTVPYGKCEFLGLKENGAGLADNEYFQKNVPDEIKKTIEEKKQEVLDGKIEIPTALGDADQNEVQALIDSVAP